MAFEPTNEQKLIINHPKGKVTIIAGPGCGKTSTLVFKIQAMIEAGTDPRAILFMTHSKALAKDIRKTITNNSASKNIKNLLNVVKVSTIHSFAYQLVQDNYNLLGLDAPPSVAKPQQQKRYIKRQKKILKIKESVLKTAFKYLESGKPLLDIEELDKKQTKKIKDAYKRFVRRRRKQNKLNFNEMIKWGLKVLQHPLAIVPPYQHLMIDELQDIDSNQKALILELSKRMESTVMVGDPLQTIYEWRSASPRYWLEIQEELKPAQYVLTETFRIPKIAMPLVNNIRRRIDKTTPRLKSNVEGYAPKLMKFPDQDSQLRFLVKEIKKLNPKSKPKGVDQRQKTIAILGRTRQELSQVAIALREQGISIAEGYAVKGVNRHREHLLALIQLAVLEQKRIARASKKLTYDDRESAKSYIDRLWLPKKTKGLLQERLHQKPKAILSLGSGHEDYDRINTMSKGVRKAAGLTNLESSIQCLIDAGKPVLKDRGDKKHQLLLRDLRDIKVKARGCTNLEEIESSLFEASKTDECEGSSIDNASVQLMTIHSAKGMEWDYVFLINVVEGNYPRKQAKESKVKEEFRLFYVAVTRHHKRLYLLQTPYSCRWITHKTKSKDKTQAGSRSSSKPVLFKEPSSFIDGDKYALLCSNKR